ncbi:hypothetical protein [Paenibacillus sp. GYB003]|uniref:hypothetical protein n=1 Tax=Paenibacillus sp. GYB003 TaxID=2994392 RepID=UPI002F962A38
MNKPTKPSTNRQLERNDRPDGAANETDIRLEGPVHAKHNRKLDNSKIEVK